MAVVNHCVCCMVHMISSQADQVQQGSQQIALGPKGRAAGLLEFPLQSLQETALRQKGRGAGLWQMALCLLLAAQRLVQCKGVGLCRTALGLLDKALW